MRTTPFYLTMMLFIPLAGEVRAQQAVPLQVVPFQTSPLQAVPFQVQPPSVLDACGGLRQQLQKAYSATALWKRRCDRAFAAASAAGGVAAPEIAPTVHQPTNVALNELFGITEQCDDTGCTRTRQLRSQTLGHYPPNPPYDDEAYQWLQNLLFAQRLSFESMVGQESLDLFETKERENCLTGSLYCQANFRQKVIQAILTDLSVSQ